jgi:aminoglycoside phosphotransferase
MLRGKIMISVSTVVEKIISGKKIIENNVGKSGDKVYKIENLEHNKNGYLKIEAKEKLFGIKHEYEVYKFLSGKIKVPGLYYYEYPYLITSEIEGVCSFHVKEEERLETMRIIARAIKELHSVDIKDCNLYSDLEWNIKNKVFSGEQLYNKPADDYVFVHGDACLPNMIIHEGQFSGFIDMGAAGVGSRYEDLAYCVWSTLHNFKDIKYVGEFFKEYGEEYYDRDKLNFYIRLLNPSSNPLSIP